MTDGRVVGDLLEAVFADPTDDAPRLVYADWLEERGRPHGEFIALQIQDHREGLGVEGRRRMRQLCGLHWRSFVGPLAPLLAKRRVSFVRGFADACRLPPDQNDLAGDPWWSTLRRLDGGGPRLALHPSMRGLESLVVRHARLGELANGPAWELRSLECRVDALSDDWQIQVAALAAAGNLPKLRSVAVLVDRGRVHPDDFAALVRGPLASRLDRVLLRCDTRPGSLGIWTWVRAFVDSGVDVPLLELGDGGDHLDHFCPETYALRRDGDGRHRLVGIVCDWHVPQAKATKQRPSGRPDPRWLLERSEALADNLVGFDPDDVAALDLTFPHLTLEPRALRVLEIAAKRFPRVSEVRVTGRSSRLDPLSSM